MQAIPSATWRMLDGSVSSTPLPKGLDAVWDTAAGLAGRFVRRTAKLLKAAEKIIALEDEFTDVADSRFESESIRIIRRHEHLARIRSGVSWQGLAEIYDSQTADRYRQGIKACQGCAIRPACGGCQAVAFGLGLDVDKDPDPYCFIEK